MNKVEEQTREKGRPAFTIIELLVVIAIIGVLATIIGVSYARSKMRTRDAKRAVDINTIQMAVDIYKDGEGGLPGTEAIWYQSNHDPWWSNNGTNSLFEADIAPYLSPLPRDPLRGDVHSGGDPPPCELTYRYVKCLNHVEGSISPCKDATDGQTVYKIDSGMEITTDKVENDGGIRNETNTDSCGGMLSGRYEIGTDLSIMN